MAKIEAVHIDVGIFKNARMGGVWVHRRTEDRVKYFPIRTGARYDRAIKMQRALMRYEDPEFYASGHRMIIQAGEVIDLDDQPSKTDVIPF